MGGLLYKDFVSVSGKKIVAITTIATVIYMILRVVFPGMGASNDWIVENDFGETVNMIDLYFVMVYMIFLILAVCSINSFVGKIVTDDKKHKIMNYLDAMPLEKNAYVASKFIFIGICAYVTFSLLTVWGVSCMAFCEESFALAFAQLGNGFTLMFVSLVLLSAAIELPMFILLGKEKAMLIKTALWLVLAMFVLGFMMFGDLVWLQSVVNIQRIIKWGENHETVVTLSNIFSVVGVLAIYFISYKITCFFAGKGGVSYE